MGARAGGRSRSNLAKRAARSARYWLWAGVRRRLLRTEWADPHRFWNRYAISAGRRRSRRRGCGVRQTECAAFSRLYERRTAALRHLIKVTVVGIRREPGAEAHCPSAAGKLAPFMQITIKRLRLLIVGLACLLVAVLGGFLVYARYRIRHFGKDLPGKLGLNIQQTANGYTVSQSEKGHTVFTIHASKLVQFKSNGHAILHDVAITLYGPPGEDREDHVYGSDFDYDQKNGVASAEGEVQIDLQSPQSGNSQPAADSEQAQKSTIHIKSSGLVFDQKTGIATTDKLVEFQLPKAAGQAIGATFDSKQGVLVLDKQVEMTTSTNGEPAVVRASHAQLLRDSRQAFLLHAVSEFRNERSSAEQAIVYFRKDGSAERIDAQGNVHTVLDNDAQTTSQTANILLNEKSQPKRADMGGGVNFVADNDAQSMHGNAVEGTLTFGEDSVLRHAQ